MNNSKMLTRKESITLLAEYGREAHWTKHCFAVADAAAKVGEIVAKKRQVTVHFSGLRLCFMTLGDTEHTIHYFMVSVFFNMQEQSIIPNNIQSMR